MDWKSYPENGSAFHFISNMLNKKKEEKITRLREIINFQLFQLFLKNFQNSKP